MYFKNNLLSLSTSKWVIILGPLLTSCVGPTTPFGAIEDWTEVQQNNDRQPWSVGESQIIFHPKMQVLHDKVDFTVEIKDPTFIPHNYILHVFHNSRDVTRVFLENSQKFRSHDGKQLIFSIKDFRLKTLDTNDIKIIFKKDLLTQVEATYQPPRCSLFENQMLKSLGQFKAPQEYARLIEDVALSANFNPSFLAGIVAQESSFDPKAVSWAKAIGLTQMTTLAEREVIGQYSQWPRHQSIEKLNYFALRSKINNGEINSESEWRLDPQKSLQGGVAYIKYLTQYWSQPQNKKVLESLSGDKDIIFSEVILASYNSGAARVKLAISKKREDWKSHHSLKEAAKYLKKVSSYCFHYSKGENSDDHET